jgi:N12 class adenine-specific DNA methylase
MSDWRPRVEAMIQDGVSPPEDDGWADVVDPTPAASTGDDGWADVLPPNDSVPFRLPEPPDLLGPLSRIGTEVARGATQGFMHGGVLDVPGETERAVEAWGPVLGYPAGTIGAGIDLAARTGAGVFRGLQGGAAQAVREVGGSEQAARDIAAIPEAFMGSPTPRAIPPGQPRPGPAPGTGLMVRPIDPGPGPAPPGAPRLPAPLPDGSRPPGAPLPTTWSEVLGEGGSGGVAPSAPRPTTPTPSGGGLADITAAPSPSPPTTSGGGYRRPADPPSPPAPSGRPGGAAVAEPPLAPAVDAPFIPRQDAASRGAAVAEPPILAGRDLPGLKRSLSDMLNDPRSNTEIAADLAARRAQGVADVVDRLPRGFTIRQMQDEWVLMDPAGDVISSTLGERPPSEETLADWEAAAGDLSRTIDYSSHLREGDGTPEAPIIPSQPNDIEAAASITAEPTPAQADAGNYRKGRVKIGPLDISIENAAGSERSGLDPSGKPWSVIMPADYGYVRRTKGADGDQVDVYLGPHAHEAKTHPVWVVDQIDPATGEFDEHKAMIGYPSEGTALAAYEAAFSDESGRARIGAVTQMGFPQFGNWARRGNTTDPLAYVRPAAETAPVETAAPTPPEQDLPAATAEPMDLPGMVPGDSAPSVDVPLPDLIAEANQAEAALAAGAAPGSPDAWDQPQTIQQPQGQPDDVGQQQLAAGTAGLDGDATGPDDTRSGSADTGPSQAPADAGNPSAGPIVGPADAGQGDGEPVGNGGGVVPESPGEPAAEPRVEAPEPIAAEPGPDTGVSPEPAAAEPEGEDAEPPEPAPAEPKGAGSDVIAEQGETDDAGPSVREDAGGVLAEPQQADVPGPASVGKPERDRPTRKQGNRGASGKSDGKRPVTARSRGDGAAGLPGPVATVATTEPTPPPPDVAEPEVAPINIPALNFTIDDAVELGSGNERQKFEDNLLAIRTLKQIEQEARRATPDEQRILARYVGWGGLKNAFRVAGAKAGEGIAKGWEKRVAALEDLLTPPELQAARASTRAAHYTSQTVVEAVWKAAERLGFDGGAVLEPSVGTGNFIGLMPPNLRGRSDVFAVEFDSITARIAQMLYPQATILHTGLQNVPLPEGQFALAIGNPPFGNESLYFRYNPAVNGKTIHHQFFQASLDAVAPKGILAMVVSHYLMDGIDPKNRLDLATRAEFIGAIRLPDTAFQENARTEVVTDIIFLRKRNEDDAEIAKAVAKGISGSVPDDATGRYRHIREQMLEWITAAPTRDPAGTDATINMNGYFVRQPGMVIGQINATGTMHGRDPSLNVTLADAAAFPRLLDQAISRLPQGVPTADVAVRTRDQFRLMADGMRLAVENAEAGAVRLSDGKLKLVVDSADPRGRVVLQEIPLTENTPFSGDYTYTTAGTWQITRDKVGLDGKTKLKALDKDGNPTKRNRKETITYRDPSEIPARHRWGGDRIAAVRAMLPIRDLLRQQLSLETQDATDRQLAANREKLNKAYDAFVKAHGPLHSPANVKIAVTMPDGGLVLSVEDPKSGDKAPIMSRRVTAPPKPVDRVENAAEAVAISLSESGAIDINRIAELLGTNIEGAEKALSEGDKPRAFYAPEMERWEPADAYLSGLVKRKLNAAREKGLAGNVAALEAVQPADWTSAQIVPNIGSGWIPASVYADFLRHLGYDSAGVTYSVLTNSFAVSAQGDSAARWRTSGRAHSPDGIVTRLLNSQSLRVTYLDHEKKTILDEVATAESQTRASEISIEFLDWVYRDDERRALLVSEFNEKFNTRVQRQRDGSHLTLPGKGPDAVVKMRRHQMNAIWRGITDNAVLYDHVVGAGKTFVAIARIMERRRMGLSRKPLVVVPKHLVEQWAADVTKLYPGAKVLAAGEKDFERSNRRRLFARIGSGDFDMVIIGHSSFGFIDLDPATEERFLMDELDLAQEAVKEAQKAAAEEGIVSFGKPFNVAEAERLVTKIEARLARARDGKRDRLLTFEQMGIDDLTVDEAHEFKNLAYSSRLVGVAGMGNKIGSNKAMDLHLKVRSLRERKGSSVAFLTGTPISNSVAEMYLVLRNLAPKELREMGLENFDAWRSMFVSASSAWEPTEAGSMKEVTRLGRNWTNMKSLMELYYSVTDAVTLEDLQGAHIEDHGTKFPVPDVLSKRNKEGDRQRITVRPSPEQREILAELVADFQALPGIRNPKERAAQRFRLFDRGRKVSLDARAVDPVMSVADGTGKIGAVVDNVFRIYDRWSDDKGTQIVFLDRSVPSSKGDDKLVRDYDELRRQLAEAEAARDEKRIGEIEDRLATFNVSEIEALRSALAGGWNAYAEIKKQLIAKGIPEGEIAFIQDANGDAAKAALFAEVRAGRVRVLIGSTPRLGAGTNVQERLVGLHHVDVTWKPSDIEQREGRIIRQGNKLLENYGDKFAVEIIAYATEMTMDAKMWSLNSDKLKAINGIRKYDGSFEMEFEDEEAASMAEMAANATGNPLMVERVVLSGEITKLETQQRGHNASISAIRDDLRRARQTVEHTPARIKTYTDFAAFWRKALGDVREASAKRSMTVAGKTFTDRSEATAAAEAEITRIKGGERNARWSIEVDGQKVSSHEQITELLRERLGTPDFSATVDGKEFIDLHLASVALAAKANKTVAEKTTITGVILNGVPVEIDIKSKMFSKKLEVDLDFSAIAEDGRTVAEYGSTTERSGTDLPVGAFRGGLEALLKRLVGSDFLGAAEQLRRQMEAAEKSIPDLEGQAEREWPKLPDLEAKRARLADVTQQLAGSSFAKALSDDAGGTPDGAALLAGWGDDTGPNGSAITTAAAEAIVQAIQQVAGPRVSVEPMLAQMRSHGGDGAVHGYALGSVVRLAISSDTPDVAFQWAGHHEVVHALRNVGLFDPGEWAALEAAVKRNDWIERFNLRSRYPGLSQTALIEEAIAEAFAARSIDDGTAPKGGLLGRAWLKTQRFMEALRNGLAGRGLHTSESIFGAMASGEIGGRTGPARMPTKGPQDLAEARAGADRWEGTLMVPGPDGAPVDLMAGMSDELKRAVASGARKAKDAMETGVRRVWGGQAMPANIEVLRDASARDINPLSRWLKTPERLFRGTELEPVIAAGIKAEQDQSRWINRLIHEYDAIRLALDKAGGSFDAVTEALWAGDADQVDVFDADQRTDLMDAWGLEPPERTAFMAIHDLLDKLARLVDNHRRSMMPKWRDEKEKLLDAIERLLDHAKVGGATATALYRRRAALTRRISSGRSTDMAADAAQIEAINVQLRALRASDPAVSKKVAEVQDAIDAVDAKLGATSVRRKIQGYVPHKFYGSWRLWEIGEPDPETGEETTVEITSDQGFFNTRGEAISAAADYLRLNPDARLRVGPKQIQWPPGMEGTVVSDAAFGQLARNLAAKAGLEGEDLRRVLVDVARRRTRRRTLGPGLFRSGAAGYSRDMDRVMRTHIGQIVRYVTMDKLKHLAISTAEAAGISPYRLTTQERPTLQHAFEAWLRDVNGNKQPLEEEIDSLLRRFPVPVPVLAAGAIGYAMGGYWSPVVGGVAAGLVGYRMYSTLTGRVFPWRDPTHHTDFPTRTFVSSATGLMAHLKLGMVINLRSALANLSQTAINTGPELGPKYLGIGIGRAARAFWHTARGSETPDTRLMQRAGVQSLYKVSEAGPVLAERESLWAKISLWAFNGAENINRAVAFFGGYVRAKDLGHSDATAMQEATRVVQSTQFHMGNANKPELLRQVWARVPGQFKNFMFQQIARLFQISRRQVVSTVAALAMLGGVSALPGFQVINGLTDLMTGWNPLNAMERTVLEWNATGGVSANAATIFARGLPAVYTDLSQSVGMGVGFMPSALTDLKGPWWTTIEQQGKAAQMHAGLVDRLALLSPAFNALKALEAAADGRQITSSAFWDPAVWGNDVSVWTDWRQKGAEVYSPSTAQLIAKSLNFVPTTETELRNLRRQAGLLRTEWQEKQQGYLSDIVQAVRERRNSDVTRITQQARADGYPLTQNQIREAVRSSRMSGVDRVLRDTPKTQRSTVAPWASGVR